MAISVSKSSHLIYRYAYFTLNASHNPFLLRRNAVGGIEVEHRYSVLINANMSNPLSAYRWSTSGSKGGSIRTFRYEYADGSATGVDGFQVLF
jgi:hypothetical protein